MAGAGHKLGRDLRPTPDAVFTVVRSHTAVEQTVDRLGTAIKVGLLAPGSRLPAERELCKRLGINRSTLKLALAALSESGHLYRKRGGGGGTFVCDPPRPADPPSPEMLARWRETWDERLAVELGVTLLAAQRARTEDIDALDQITAALDRDLEDFAAYSRADRRLHVGLAEATQSPSLVRRMTAVQGSVSDLIAHVAHPPEVRASSNAQHRRILAAVRERDALRAVCVMTKHLQSTEQILAGLLPES